MAERTVEELVQENIKLQFQLRELAARSDAVKKSTIEVIKKAETFIRAASPLLKEMAAMVCPMGTPCGTCLPCRVKAFTRAQMKPKPPPLALVPPAPPTPGGPNA